MKKTTELAIHSPNVYTTPKALEGPQPDYRQVPTLYKIQLGGPKPDFARGPKCSPLRHYATELAIHSPNVYTKVRPHNFEQRSNEEDDRVGNLLSKRLHHTKVRPHNFELRSNEEDATELAIHSPNVYTKVRPHNFEVRSNEEDDRVGNPLSKRPHHTIVESRQMK
ncbi:hypothetical protein TNCV_3854491 [Trichonephila clavipes]|nr:hypothetical protein TNCV_3854491 [Trichonephila clavipes]